MDDIDFILTSETLVDAISSCIIIFIVIHVPAIEGKNLETLLKINLKV